MSIAERNLSQGHEGDGHEISPTDIAIGVVIGRTSEFFDFFVFAIACVIVFPERFFPFAEPLTATMWSFAIFSLAFIARPIGTVIFTEIDRLGGKNAKLTLAMILLGAATVAMGLLPSYESIGGWAIALLAFMRVLQGFALGGAWDGLASLLAKNSPSNRRGFYAMVPQLGAPLGLIVASLLFAFLVSELSAQDFLEWGWRYPFFVAFAINVVALFARLRIVVSPEYEHAFREHELDATPIREAIKANGVAIATGALVPLASLALFHMVTVFPLSWVFLFTNEAPVHFLLIEALAAAFGFVAVAISGVLADMIGRRRLVFWTAIVTGAFSLIAPMLLAAGGAGEAVYMIVGFIILGLGFGQSSGAIASLFKQEHRYTSSALVSDLAWLFGAGFAPLIALVLSAYLGLFASGLYLLSGAVCSAAVLIFVRRMDLRHQ